MAEEIAGQSQQAPVKKPSKRKSTATSPGVSDILDRRNESRRYMQVNYWDQWEDIYRASKCRTQPIMVTDKSGNKVEDTSRTNVAMPELSLMIRRKTARLTANPPQINYTTSDGTEELGERLTAWAYQQFDRSGEAREHRKLVQGAQTFGSYFSKTSWDTVEVNKKFFRSMTKGDKFPLTRTGLLQLQGTPDDEISDMVAEHAEGDNLGDAELTQAMAQFGNAAQIQSRVKQFEGPVTKAVFTGDFFMEPGAAYLDVSGWAIENYFESDVWLKKMQSKTWIDPDSGEELPIFDPKAVQELSEMPSWQPTFQQQPFDLRSRLRTGGLGQTLPLWPTKLLKGKRYDILECHTKDADGRFWIEWVGNEKVSLGKMCYPWDLYGKYVYTELVPMFDLLGAYGDSSPLLLRHLWLLHNAIVGSRRDLVANLLRPLMKAKAGADIPDEQIDRMFMRIISMRNPDDLTPFNDAGNLGPAIMAASEEEAQNMRMMALAEPNLTNVDSGTESNPQAGKTATTAVLAAKSADTLMQFEIDSLNWYLKDVGEKKLAMLQQVEPETDQSGNYKPYQIATQYVNKVEGLTQRYGKASVANLDFMELQQEIEVEPAAMSMLSIDDEIRRTGAQQLVGMAAQMPSVVDPYYAARTFAGTIRGVDPDKAVPPPKPPVPPPPKVSVAVAAKYELLPPEAQAAIVSSMGAEVTPATAEHMQIDQTLQGIERMSQTADAADNLMSEKSVDDEPETNLTKGVGDAKPAKSSAK